MSTTGRQAAEEGRPEVDPEDADARRYLPIDLLAMSDAHDQDGQLLVDGFVDDSIAAYTKPSQTSELALQGRTS